MCKQITRVEDLVVGEVYMLTSGETNGKTNRRWQVVGTYVGIEFNKPSWRGDDDIVLEFKVILSSRVFNGRTIDAPGEKFLLTFVKNGNLLEAVWEI